MTEHSHASAYDAHDHSEPHGGVGKYVMVFVALCILTAISFAVGNSQTLRHSAPEMMWAMMMAVSCCKALLVILFFMHVLWEANWKYVLTIPATMMSLFLLLMLVPDIGRRTLKYSEERWLLAPTPRPVAIEYAPPGTSVPSSDHGHPPAGKSRAAH